MIPFLMYPLALLGLASIPALAAIYIFRNRFRRRQVSSLMLWRFGVQTRQGGAKVHRLKLPLIFFLELLTLLLLVVAATGPQWKLQSNRPLIVILDDSFSMQAGGQNVSAQNRAREFLENLLRRQSPPSTRLILAGTEPRLLGAAANNLSEINDLLGEWKCWSPVASIDTAITLAAEIGKQQANILVLTDHAPEDKKITSDRLQWRAFGNPVGNVAFVNASRTALGEQDRCLLEVANFSDSPQRLELTVQNGTNALQQTRASFAPNERQRFVFNIPASTAVLKAALDADSLPVDNEVQLLPPIRKRVRVQVSLADPELNSLVERTLEATGLRAAISQNPELVIHQSASPTGGSNAWTLRWISSPDASAYTGPFVIDTAHPLAQGMALEGVVWAASAVTNPPAEVPVILAGNVPLLSVREELNGRRHLTLNLNAQLSTIHNSPDWPILFWNILQWRASQIPGLFESNARLGAEVGLKTTGEPVTVTLPDNSQKVFSKTGDELALETPLPGLYSVQTGQSTNLFAVNPLAAEESDLAACSKGNWGEWRDDAERRFEESSVVWLFALAALAVLSVHLCFIALGKGSN